MEVRHATVADAEAIERVRIRGWQIAYRHVFPAAALDALTVDATRWRETLTAPPPGFTYFVAVADGGVVGFAVAGPSAFPDRFGELHALYVDPDAWSRGAGRALLARAEEELALQWDEAVLWTLADNPRAAHVYRAAGWRFDGTTGTFDRLGVRAPVVRYAKRLRSSTSRS